MNPAYDFTDQVALVTGAGSGMGLATAKAFADAGGRSMVVSPRTNSVRSQLQKLFKGAEHD